MRKTLIGMVPAVLLALATACSSSGASASADPDEGFQAQPTPTGTAADMAACLEAKGWQMEVNLDNSYSVGGDGIPEEQVEQYFTDQDDCRRQLGHDQPLPPMTRAQAEVYFEHLLAVADCVRDEGYPVGEPPSRQVAVEALMQPTIDLGDWPYGPLHESGISPLELEALYAACPLPARPS